MVIKMDSDDINKRIVKEKNENNKNKTSISQYHLLETFFILAIILLIVGIIAILLYFHIIIHL